MEICLNFRLVGSQRVKDMDQLPSPTCEDTIQGAHFGGGLMGATRCTRSGLSGSHDSCWPVSGSEGPNRPFWAQSRPAAVLNQPHVPLPWIYGLGSHGGGLQCPLLAHPMVSRGDRYERARRPDVGACRISVEWRTLVVLVVNGSVAVHNAGERVVLGGKRAIKTEG